MDFSKVSGWKLLNAVYYTCKWSSYELEFLIEYDSRKPDCNDKYGIYYGVRVIYPKPITAIETIEAINAEWKGFIAKLQTKHNLPIHMTDNAGAERGYWIFWVSLGDWQDINIAVEGVERIFCKAQDHFVKDAFSNVDKDLEQADKERECESK